MNLKNFFTASMTAHVISIVRAQSSKCPPFARAQARRHALHQLRYQLHSLEGRAKCPTAPQHRELATGTRAAGPGGK